MRLTERIQSRKFILAFLACAFFAITGTPEQAFPSITQVVVGYLAVSAAQDAVQTWQTTRTTEGE